MSTRLKLIISYDGSNYMGFQAQKQGPTIEEKLTLAITKMTGEKLKIYGSGRTDRYVHAKGQVVHFDSENVIEPSAWKRGLNAYLPLDIRVISVEEVGKEFHSRFSAKQKEYRYYIMKEYDLFYRNYAAFYPHLNVDLMIEAIKLFEGNHNFRGFCSVDVNEQKDFNKIITEASIKNHGKFIEFKFIGNGFLKYQIRRMIGLLIDIGLNKKDSKYINEVFLTMDPKLSHKVAMGCGLYLMSVVYEDVVSSKLD